MASGCYDSELNCIATQTYLNESFHIKKKNTFTFSCEKSKTVSFAPSTMKNIVALFYRSRFPVKLICCIAFGSKSSACCLLKSIAINL